VAAARAARGAELPRAGRRRLSVGPHLLLGVAGAVLAVVPAAAVARRLALGSVGREVLAAAVLAWASVVALALALSAAGAFARGPLLAAQAALALAVLVVARRRPAAPTRRPSLAAALARARALDGDTVAAGAGVAVAALLSLVVAVGAVPNNPDSMVYHLSRAAYWVQEQSIFHFRGAGARQAAMPPNGEILMAWQMALTSSDRLTQAVQWSAYVLCGLGVYELGRLLRFGVPAAAFAAVIFLAMPQPFLQSSSTQNDLIVAFALLAAAIFGARGLMPGGSTGQLAVAAVAVGLAIGAKSTALIAVPLIAVALAVLTLRERAYRRAGFLLVASITATLALATVNYAQNLAEFGRITAPEEFTERGAGGPGPVAPLGPERAKNLVRMAWSTFVETTPFEPGRAGPAVASVATRIAPQITTRDAPDRPPLLQFGYAVTGAIDEDASGYGLIGLLVLLPCVAWALVRGPADRRLVALLAVGGLVLLSQALRYSTANGRILLPFVAFAAPLMGVAARSFPLRALALTVAACGLLTMALVNPSKPILPQDGRTVFDLSRNETQGLRNREFAGAMRALRRYVGPREPLGVHVLETAYDYPLFGPRLERPLYRVVPGVDDERRGIVGGRRVAGIFYAGVAPPGDVRAIELVPSHLLVLYRR